MARGVPKPPKTKTSAQRLGRLAEIRAMLNEAAAVPYHRAMTSPYPLKASAMFMAIPLEMAGAGLTVSCVQKTTWRIEVIAEVDDDLVWHVSGDALSLHTALFQVIDLGQELLDKMESNERAAMAPSLAAAA